MVHNSILTATAIAVMAGSALGADYLFPSSNPPAGKTPSEVNQYVSFIWDDNGYSGEIGTIYEPRALRDGEVSLPYEEYGYVGGMGPSWDGQGGLKKTDGNGKAYNNKLNIGEGDMGLSWAVKTLGAKLKGGTMTFNMISGLFIPSWGPEWYERESEYGSFIDGKTKNDEGQPVDFKIAVAWGREQLIGSEKGKQDVQISYMLQGVKKMIAAGHEIGNHTIDHLETNSAWPENLWPNNGDGFDAGGPNQTDMLGEPWDEKAYGYSDYLSTHGWKKYAGKKLKKDTWKDIIKLGEQDGPKNGINEELVGFRAPRLEINSSMFYALKEKGYLYDCGVEEGLEADKDGTNFLWPYTTDNGIPNFHTQVQNGENLFVDSLPSGLWEIPVNVMIVPEEIRADVWESHAKIRAADGDAPSSDDRDYWMNTSGKVTGFDFNMFILWGMTKDQALKTMKHTLDLHYDNNRAPMQVGCHTDYFTPMYDFATLAGDDVYKLALEKNTWIDRKESFEEFVSYAAGKSDVKFVSGKDLISEIKNLQRGEDIGDATALPSSTSWSFLNDDVDSKDNADASSFKGNSFSGDITLNASDDANKKYAYSSYVTSFGEGELRGLTHIELNYNANSAFAVRIYVDGDKVIEDGAETEYNAAWEVVLNNTNHDVYSGAIPISAFAYGPYSQGNKEAIDVNKITGIEIAPLGKDTRCTFDISDIKLYGVDFSVPVTAKEAISVNSINVTSMSKNALKLNVAKAGSYKVDIFTANGRIVRSIDSQELSSGIQSIPLNNVPAGLYMVKITGDKVSLVTKAVAL